jgi:alpha-glucosidase (family GH31 glycosyl hydrolase)
VHFPDFISQEGQQWWLDQVRAFYADVKFDGLWVDMNEPSNFCTGHVCELPPPELLDFVDPSARASLSLGFAALGYQLEEGLQLMWLAAGAKPFFTFGTEPPACQLQCWSLEPYLKQWLLQEQSFSHMPSADASGALLGSLVRRGGIEWYIILT